MNWTIRYHRLATAAIYQIERGTAAAVTEAIRQLARNPRPPESQPLSDTPETRPDTYFIEPAGHLVVYELWRTEQIVHIIFID